MEHYQISSESQ